MFIELGATEQAINWITDWFNDSKDDMKPEEQQFFEKGLNFLKEHTNGFEVNTLEEYFEILEMIAKITDGNYNICNQGKFISLDY